MAKKINRSFADAFSEALEQTEEWQSEINLKKFVEETFFSIECAREKSATWEQIAVVLQKTIGDSIEVKADTVRQYYFDAVSKRKELAKKKRQKASRQRTKSASPSQKSSATVKSNQNSFGNISDTENRNVADDSENSFNLRPRKEGI